MSQNVILMVDDNRTICEVVRVIFRESVYNVEPLPDAASARAYLAQKSDQVAVMLLDWEMPGESGLDFLKFVKSQHAFRLLPVIMLTGRTDPEDVEAGISAGAMYYVTKPFDPRILKTLVETALADFVPAREQRPELEAPIRLLREALFEFKTIQDASSLAAALATRCPDPDSARLGLHELLVNAVEHGNLGITHEEKSQLLGVGKLPSEIEKRMKDPTYATRIATVRVVNRAADLHFLIADQGAGFDFARYLSLSPERAFSQHGRGIAIARHLCFDHLEYTPPGNQVSAIIRKK